MMQIVYFSQKEQFLTRMDTHPGNKLYIAPSPAKADGLRERMKSGSASDVITIAKFTSNLVEALWESREKPQVKRKSDLLLIFGILKKRYLPELGYEQFTQAYNLFSDLRSFTLNQEVLSSVLEEQPEEIRKAVQLFWQLLDLTGFLDEHGAYQKITETLRSAEDKDELRKTYVFWGFQHLNGQQVDLLKALAIRYEVIIPFPLSLKEKLKKSDWISWLKDVSVQETELEVTMNEPKGILYPANSRENASLLKGLLKDGDQVILGVSKLSPLHLDLIPSKKVSYKIPHQLVQAEIAELAGELKDSPELLKDLRSLMKPGMFKRYKAIQLYEDALNTISELSSEEIIPDRFFLKLLHEVVALNQPRTSYVPMSSETLTVELKDMSTLEEVNRNRRVILCIDERFEDIQGLGQNYSEAIQKSLAALGPLKRNELELLFRQWEFSDLFSYAEVLVLMSESTLKHSLIWKRLFADINLSKMDKLPSPQGKQLSDHFKNLEKKQFSGSFSASKFQTFIDCPRKFYFSYIDKVFPSVALEKDFDPMVSGTIIHRIIELFHKQKLELSELPRLTKSIMEEFILKRKLNLPRETYLQRELIFNHRALNGIQFLKRLEEVVGEKITWHMEEEFDFTEEYKLTGKIDCIGVGEKNLLLLDFKSTKFSASSNKEVEEMESVQLWAYAKAVSVQFKDFDQKSVVLGYVVLDNPAESNMLCSDESLVEKLKLAKICRQKKLGEDFSVLFKLAAEKLVALSVAIRAEKDFPALPRKSGACHFCELTRVCVKSEVKDV